jgi:predicted benzoate:H+ symporter BenE
LGAFSSFSIGGPVFHPINNCEHPLLYLPGTGIASQETAILGSFQKNLAGICNSVCTWWLIMGWTRRWDSLWMVHPFVLAPNFVSITPSTS